MMSGMRSPLRMIRCARVAIMTVAALRNAYPQQSTKPLPKFEAYPVRDVFHGVPHAPIPTAEQRLYQTQIRDGVEKGWGVWVNGQWSKDPPQPEPNFAGHYIVIFWGCGTGCIRMAISNAQTGAIYGPPISAGGFALPMLMGTESVGRAPDVEYRIDSRLMIVKATPHWERRDAVSYAFYFLWRGERWTLLRRVPLEE